MSEKQKFILVNSCMVYQNLHWSKFSFLSMTWTTQDQESVVFHPLMPPEKDHTYLDKPSAKMVRLIYTKIFYQGN